MKRLITAVALLAIALPLAAGEVASGKLDIIGITLEVEPNVTTGADIPAQVQTKLGGKTGDDVPANTMTVAADLTGPGLDAPLTILAKPGAKLALPPLHEQGDYALLNVRLLDDQGRFIQPAVPASVSVKVVGVLATSVTIRQLTPDELRARGITVDSRNYDVYDYSFTFAIGNQIVVVPYPVIIDKRTHEAVTPPGQPEYQLPKPSTSGPPPRFQPPSIVTFVMEDDFSGGGGLPPPGGDTPDKQRRKPVIPAALVIPTGFGVLHQFFAVILNVSNSAPAGSQIVLDGLTATINTPIGLRVVKVNPAVTIGQPVPIRDSKTGATFLVATAEGSADWSLEALRTGTQTVDIEIRATYKQTGQIDVPLKGHVSSSLLVSDPRFQINFVHPDNIRQFETYTAYAFITNTSASQQTVRIDNNLIPTCDASNTAFSNNICRVEGTPPAQLTLAAGQTVSVPYKLKSSKTGHIYAASAAAPDGIEASITLTMGVSETGIPLSPATLIMPWYAQYLSSALVEAQMPLLGLAYSVATAPMTPKTALLPRIIRNDVFQRAQDIARAGERVFITRRAATTDDPAEDREAVEHLSLDLLGNVERVDRLTTTAALAEWDQLRMSEQDGRLAGAAMARELERTGLAGGKSLSQFAAGFATATSHRSPYFFALVHGGTMTVTGATSGKVMSGAAEQAGWVRTLPFGELTQLSSPTESGQLALVGRWSEALQLAITPSSSSFTVDLIYPDTADGAFLTTSFTASASGPVTLTVDRGNRTLIVSGAAVTPLVNPVAQTPLAVTGAAQDLHLDPTGHIVSVLFNRPIQVTDASSLRDLVSLTTEVTAAGYLQTRKNTPLDPTAPVVIPGAAVQDDGKILNISFDHALSQNAKYTIGLDPINDLRPDGIATGTTSFVPRIDNNQPGGIVLGKVLRGDGTAVGKTLVQLNAVAVQYDTTLADGTFIFEFIPRDIDRGLNGNYKLQVSAEGKFASLDGTVRTPGDVQRVVLQFLGRGSAAGRVTYSDGSLVVGAPVTAGSTFYNEFHRTLTDDKGEYKITDLPVGPITFAVQDAKGNVTYAASQIRQPGEVVTQDLVIQKRELSGLATIRVLVKRSDTDGLVPGAHVGVWAQGYGLTDGFTDISGRIEFRDIPAGFISILAAEFGISNESANIDLDVKPDSVLDQTLILHVPTAAEQAQFATLEGDVKKDDPTAPGDLNKLTPVPGALIALKYFGSVTADNNGHYVFTGVPVSQAGKNVLVIDPATGRRGNVSLPTPLNPGATNPFPITLFSSVPEGNATLRVRLRAASGEAVSNYRVIWPGYPVTEFANKFGGIYELNVKVPARVDVWAVPVGRDPNFGDQVAHGSINADFDGQVSVLDLRLPGQGTIKASILVKKPCPNGFTTCPDSFDVAQGLIGVSYRVWSEQEQGLIIADRDPAQTQNGTGIATIPQVPVGEDAGVETIDHPAGYAAARVTLGFEGDTRQVDLKVAQLGDVTGRVYNYDGQTPVAGASIKFAGSFVNLDDTTRFDGSFRFPGVAAAQSFHITARVVIDGIERQGYVDGTTPANGGPVSGMNIVLREQASIDGIIVDAAGNPVPLARYWAVGLAWPYQTFDSSNVNPLIADQNGRFVLNNVFTGAVRVSASSPVHQEDRGEWQGVIQSEGDRQTGVRIVIGTTGSGSLSVTVVDSDNAFQRVPNAEVALLRNGSGFDFATTDSNGVAFFSDLPVTGVYALRATSKKVGRSGSSDSFGIAANATTQKQVVLDLLGRVSGTLTDGDIVNTPPVKGAPVYLSSTGLNTAATSDGAGAFRFNGVPEGTFTLDAIDLDTGRHARTPNPLTISKTIQEINGIALRFEKTGTLRVKVYLPDDHGNSSGVLAPLATVLVSQAGYRREAQFAGSEVLFTKMFANLPFAVEVTELGGEGRVAHADGTFPQGSFETSSAAVFPAFGTVEVHVTADDASFIPNARVTIAAGNKGATVFTDSSGIVSVGSMPLGPVSVQVVSGILAAAGSGQLQSHSQALVVTVKLAGNRAILDGFVDAEAGGPSAGTRVLLDVSSPALTGPLHLETRTDSTGKYLFQGVPVSSTHVTLTMLGPDDVTPGARASKDVADGTAEIQIDRVRLDATPPQVIGLDPANNANSVSPNAKVFITFSEPLQLGSVNTANFQLMATDDSTAVSASVTPEIFNGQYRVRIEPVSLLRSNLVYRVSVSNAVMDLAGNLMKQAVASSFTTVNYTEPRIIRVDPPVEQPLADGATFRLKFNKPIEIASLNPGNGGAAKIERLDSFGGTAVENIPIAPPRLDLTDSSTLILAPTGVAIQPSSFYRVTVSGVRDTQQPPNLQKEAQHYDYFSFDRIRPVATIVSPVPAGAPLVSGVSYTPVVTVVDEGTTPPAESKDIKYVDWLLSDGVHPDQAVARVFVKPWGYTFPAPIVTSGTATLTLKAIATDLSNNFSDAASFTWTIVPNGPPTDVAVAVSPASVYLGGRVTADVTFKDEGLKATVNVDIAGKHLDGTDYHLDAAAVTPKLNQQVTRASVGDPWPRATFGFNVPANMLEGAPVHVTATVTDSDNQTSAPATSDVQILTDTNPPQILSVTPAADTEFTYPATYTVTVKVKDAETPIARVALNYDGIDSDATGTYDSAAQTWTFTKNIDVTRKVADTRVRILATAYDLHGNKAQAATEVIYKSINDGSLPVAQWITPLDGAALPAGQQVTLKLRVHATDDRGIESVTFTSSAFTVAPVTTPGAGDLFERQVTFTVPAAAFTITATVNDADPGHAQTLPISIDVVQAEPPITGDGAITAGTAANFAGKSLVVSGANTHFYINVPITLQNLIVLGGAQIGNPDRVKLDLTIKDHLFVEADASIDLTGKGYAGGWRSSEDGVTLNDRPYGLTAGGAAGATGGASASHGGLGADGASGATNAAYGSIADPSDFGAGGAGSEDGAKTPGGRGGGAMVLHGGAVDADLGRFVVAGAIRADGDSGIGRVGAGAGGSVSIKTHALITGPATRISANGGDDDGANNAARGAGGGRVAIAASDRFDLLDAQGEFSACGGRNVAGEGRTQLDGGAGTVFLRKPGAAIGELIVSAYDERSPSSTHLTRPTPLSSTNGSLTFDALTAGPRALARFDSDYAVAAANVKIDATAAIVNPTDAPLIAITTTPAAGGNIIQNTSLAVAINASTKALVGLGQVRFDFTAGTPAPVAYPDYPDALSGAAASVTVAPDAQLGAATLQATVTDRAGRTATTAVNSYTVVANTPPAITRFDVTPSSLQMYAGGTISIDAAATDDVAVSSLDLTASAGTLTRNAPVVNGTTTSRTFTVSTAKTLAGGTDIQLTLKADDSYAAHTATQQKTVTVLHDPNPPVVTVTSPPTDALFEVSSTVIIPIKATVVDAEVGVTAVWATIDGGPHIAMVPDPSTPNGWMVDAAVPPVDGADPVAKQIVVSATDYEPNTGNSASRRIFVKPAFDPLAPVVAWLCPTPAALFPPGYGARLRVNAVPAKPENDVSGVSFFVGTSSTPYAATKIAGTTTWEAANVPMPSGNDGDPVPLRVVATAVGNKSTELRLTVALATGVTIDHDTTIISGDDQYATSTLIVKGAKLTVDGAHTFARLIVLDGATVQHRTLNASGPGNLSLTITGTTYVSCLGAIDTTGLGYAGHQTYPGATLPGPGSGGSHIGKGGLSSPPLSSTYGSVVRPQEAGAGGENPSDGRAGGGVVRITAASLAVDGVVRSNGFSDGNGRAGAGGSIWITSGKITGAGTIEADGGTNGFSHGGGGAVAVEYSDATSTLPTLRARTGAAGPAGGAGSVYVKGPSALYGDLTIDNGGISGEATELPSLGAGTALSGTSGATLVTDRASDIPPYFAGHWVEITSATGTPKGTWRIASVSAKTATLSPNGTETIALQAGDRWQGVYHFDTMTLRGVHLDSADPIRVTDEVIDSGSVEHEQISAANLRVKGTAVLTHHKSGTLVIAAANEVRVDATAAIDVTGRGYAGHQTYPGATLPGPGSGGSHIGKGGLSSLPLSSTYGSVVRPQEAGAGGESPNDGRAGGGVVRITAGSLVVDGAVRSNGFSDGNGRAGAGGSIWITSGRITGTGTIEADGGTNGFSHGGGGAVAVEYSDATSTLPTLRARTGAAGPAGGAGSVYVKGPAAVYGDLIVDNGGFSGQVTELPSLGAGTALSGTSGATLVTDRANDIPPYFAGHWVEITSATGVLKGTWRIASVSARSATLSPNGTETIALEGGDRWQGVYRFDNVNVRNGGKLVTGDVLRSATSLNVQGPADLQSPVSASTVVISGSVSATQITSTDLTVSAAATLTQSSTDPLRLNVSGTLTVLGAIDVTGRGFGANQTYPGATLPGPGSGGSHIGKGGLSSPPLSSTYGSITRPQEAGAGGENSNDGRAGGGVVRITAGTLVVDGFVRSNGFSDGNGRAGAGGSIWITSSKISGAGTIEADGGINGFSHGGGGAVAVEYSDVTSTLPTLRARTGAAGPAGGAGSVYVRGPAAVFGDLIVDNGGISGQATDLPSLGAGAAVNGTSGATLVTDRATDIPPYFAGHWVEIAGANGTLKGTWRIASVSAKAATLSPNASETIALQPGDTWRGIYRFDNVRLIGANVTTGDRLDSTSAIQFLSGATLAGNNQAPPVVDKTKISISAGALGPVMIGQPGAVADLDQPITVVALNQTAALTFSATAAADGSFTVALRGSTGDSIAVFARDGNLFPLQSQPVFIGTLSSSNITPASVPITPSMTTDGSFRARRLAFDGNTLVAQTYPIGVDSNKLLVFDLSSGIPSWVQTIAVPANTRDVAVRDNVAYVATGTFYAYDLSLNPATRQQAGTDCGDAYSVAVDGSYAYVGGNCGDGHIAIYDITNPKVPVLRRSQGTGVGGTYTQLIPYGNYMIAITPNGGTSGPDVVMIDRRDVNNLVKVWDRNITGFTGFRGSIQGTTLYVSSLEGGIAVLDLSNPAVAVVRSVFQAGIAAHGITAVGALAMLAADTSGLLAVSASDPANPTGAGGVATSPAAAWDVVVRGQLGIIAAEDRLLTFTATVPPQVNVAKISMSFDGHSVTVQGAPAAILGRAPVTAAVKDETTSVTASGVAVAADGSFSATLAAAAGDRISIVATDANGATSGVVPVGVVPFGTSTNFVPISAALANNDGGFRARHMAIDGTTLAAIDYPYFSSDSNKLVVFSIAGGTPVWSQTISVPGNTRDVVVRNNVAYVATGTFYAYDLTVNPATRQQAGTDCGDAYSVAVDGSYAYVGGNCGDGHIAIYDITDPKVPVLLRSQGTGVSMTYTQLIPYGNYLVAISPNGGASGVDVVIIDRRDINNLVKVSATAITGVVGFRGAVTGHWLYLSSDTTTSSMAVVDLTDVTAPAFTVAATVGGSRGIAAAGNVVAVGEGGPGVSFFDVSNPAAPRLIGTQSVGGTSWDVRFAGGKLYAAAEEGIAVINGVVAPPVVDVARISIARTTATTATVAGSAGAITGAATPITAVVKDETTSVTASGVAMAADGSFSASIAAAAGDRISIVATDANGATSGVVPVGVVPFGTSTSFVPISAALANNDGGFRARHMAIDGTTLAAIDYPYFSSDSNKLVVFSIAGGTPVWSQTISVPGNTRDVVVRNNVAYVATGTFYAYDLTVNPATRQQAGTDCGDAYSVAVDGSYAYVGGNCGDGHIAIYDITNPKVPVLLRSQGTGVSMTYTQLIPYGNYLVAISPNGGASGVDVVIIDRRDINNLVKVSATAITGVVGFRGAVTGHWLYLSSDTTTSSMAVVDLTDVTAPAFTVAATVGGSRGIAAAGNVVAVGEGGPGVSFFDVSNPAAPRLIGTQSVGGTSWDVRFAGGKLYAAAEEGIAVINGVVAPPVVDVARISIARTTATTATVAGSAGAITGAATPITAVVKDETTSVTASGVAMAADGSFSASIAAAAGDRISIVATDANGATSGIIALGSVPFGPATLAATGASASGAGEFRARRLWIDGSTLATVTWPVAGAFDNNRALVFDITTGAPVLAQVLTVPGNTRDVVVKNNTAYVATGTLYTYDLSVNPATRAQAGTDCGDATSVAVDGGHAFVGGTCGDGRIAIYDLTNPKAPVLTRSQATLPGTSGINYTQLIPYGTSQLVAISPSFNTRGHDVVIIDRSNLSNLVTVADIDIPNIDLFRARIVGHMLYGASWTGGVAIVDLDHVTANAAIVPTPGIPRALEVDPVTLRVYVADGCPGLTVIDAAVPSTARVIGTQSLPGNSWDAMLGGTKLYLASEQMINVVDIGSVGGGSAATPAIASTPPAPLPEAASLRIDRGRIAVARGAGAFVVRGVPGALAGRRPISIEIRNLTLGTSVPVVPVAENGSFAAAISAAPGDHLTLEATSGEGERIVLDLGDAPETDHDK